MVRISGLVVYPVKGLRGIELAEAAVEPQGLAGDRRWMLIDEDNIFLSQRTTPRMCLYRTRLDDGRLTVHAPDGDSLAIGEPEGDRIRVEVWEDECDALLVSPSADEWFSRQLGIPCRMVYMPDDAIRPANQKYAKPGDRVGFADGFPVLVASEASLEDLNSRLQSPIPMNRFRANILFTGCDAFAEDAWPSFEVGGVSFRAAKHCVRCQVTTTNQDTAEIGKEPLTTLASYRREGNGVIFGSYFVPEGRGRLWVGQECLGRGSKTKNGPGESGAVKDCGKVVIFGGEP